MDIVYELTKAFTSFIITNKTVEQSRQPIEIENGFRCLSQDVFSFGPALFYPISILSIILVLPVQRKGNGERGNCPQLPHL